MPNDTRCPKCRGLGSPGLNNYCRKCDFEMFADQIYSLCGQSQKLLDGALLEVGAKKISQVKRKDRAKLLTVIKKRKPASRRVDLVQATAPLESAGGAFVEPEGYAVEKGVTPIER